MNLLQTLVFPNNKKNRIMKKNSLFLILGIIVFFTACKKTEHDETKPTISISEPMINDTISLAVEDSVHLMISAADNDVLHEMTIRIYNNTNTLVYSATPTVHDLKVYSFHEHYKPTNILGVTAFTLKVTAVDHHENIETKSVLFYVKP